MCDQKLLVYPLSNQRTMNLARELCVSKQLLVQPMCCLYTDGLLSVVVTTPHLHVLSMLLTVTSCDCTSS
jgi:hypothetical protein